MASAADGYGGGADDQLHHHHHQHNVIYHVPQQSRLEKLRFPPEETSFQNTTPPLHLTTFLPSSSSSASSYYCSQNPNYSLGQTSQFAIDNPVRLPTQITHQPFSLTLSSSSSTPPPPRHWLTDRPVSDHPAQLGPFTGYAAILNRSRFLEPARQILEEICDVGRGGEVLQYADASEPLPVDYAMEGLEGCGGTVDIRISGVEEQQWKKTRLISMLDEVYKRYQQYCQQVQAVITLFELGAGLSTAAPYASMALKAMSKHFRCLKDAISDQLHHINKALGKEGFSKEENSVFGLTNSGVSPHRMAKRLGTVRQSHVWRPQRGLPERAVAVLRAWLFEHFLHPYPTDTDKQMLAKQTGLSRNQVSNWFINARVRLWKPMVEEVHSLEMRQLHEVAAGDKNLISIKQAQLPSASTSTSFNDPPPQNTVTQKNQNPSSKRSHKELTSTPNVIEEQYNFVYDKLSGEGVDVRGNGVSLTLGLRQNNGVCLAEPLPLNVRRFGLDECNDAYVIGACEVQDRHFGKDIGGHLLRDFVG